MSALTLARQRPHLIIYVLLADTLELQAEKQSAHSDCIHSVAFSPDGKTIVSGSDDKTIKVWDAVNFRPYNASEWEEVKLPDKQHVPGIGSGEKVDEYWKNNATGLVQDCKPSAGPLIVN